MEARAKELRATGEAGQVSAVQTTAPTAGAIESTPPVTVPDLNPWPERLNAAEAPATALAGVPEPEPTPFRSSMAPWPAVDADPDAADTDMDLVQARQERRS